MSELGGRSLLPGLDFSLPAPILDLKKHHDHGQNRSGARPSGPCAGGGHSLELLKAKMLFLESKYVQDNTMTFNLVSQRKFLKRVTQTKGSCPSLLPGEEEKLGCEAQG